MDIPKIEEQDIIDALKYIDENDVPSYNQSMKYVLVTEDGKKYPPKYIIAVADYLTNRTEITTEGFIAVRTKNYLQGKKEHTTIWQLWKRLCNADIRSRVVI